MSRDPYPTVTVPTPVTAHPTNSKWRRSWTNFLSGSEHPSSRRYPPNSLTIARSVALKCRAGRRGVDWEGQLTTLEIYNARCGRPVQTWSDRGRMGSTLAARLRALHLHDRFCRPVSNSVFEGRSIRMLVLRVKRTRAPARPQRTDSSSCCA